MAVKNTGRKKAASADAPQPSVTYKPDDKIICKSILVGRTFMPGIRSKQTYEFESENAEREVRYDDLVAAVNSHSAYLFKPMIIVEDEKFVQEHPKLKALYDEMYSPNDLSRILSLKPADVKRILPKIPVGARDAIKNIAAKMIADGSLNDVRVIKVIDEVVGTQLMLTTGLYD